MNVFVFFVVSFVFVYWSRNGLGSRFSWSPLDRKSRESYSVKTGHRPHTLISLNIINIEWCFKSFKKLKGWLNLCLWRYTEYFSSGYMYYLPYIYKLMFEVLEMTPCFSRVKVWTTSTGESAGAHWTASTKGTRRRSRSTSAPAARPAWTWQTRRTQTSPRKRRRHSQQARYSHAHRWYT